MSNKELEIGQNWRIKGNTTEWTVVEFTDECATLTCVDDPTKTKNIAIKKTLYKNYEPVPEPTVMEPETIEEVELVEAELVETLTAVVKDGGITEITGVMRNLMFTEDFKNGEMQVEDLDGNTHTINVTGKTKVWNLLYRHNPSKYLYGMDSFVDASPEDQNNEITAICANNKILVFRTYEKEGVVQLYAPVSINYKKSRIEDFTSIIQETLGDSVKIITNPSTGFHGGSAHASLITDDIATYKIIVDMGDLNGSSSIKIRGTGMILACSNQMTLDVSKAFKDVPTLNLNTRLIHTGDNTETFSKNLNEVISVMEDFSHILTEAQNIFITPEFTAKILTYYEKHGMSKKSQKLVEELMLDDNRQQVPGSVWGLAMAITYAGTHTDKMGKTVEENLRRIGGELLMVATNWTKYEEIINSKVPTIEEPKFRAEVYL